MLTVFVLCLLAAGFYQLALVFSAQDVLHHAARSAARARTVGFNAWMVEKCARVACIPNAGPILTPTPVYTSPIATLIGTSTPGQLWDYALSSDPTSPQLGIELARIPEYLGSQYPLQASYVLDYQDWNSIQVTVPGPPIGVPSPVTPMLHAQAEQDYPMRVPMRGAFWGLDHVTVRGDCYMESHYDLYIQDMGW
jgi:hypothetical protein